MPTSSADKPAARAVYLFRKRYRRFGETGQIHVSNNNAFMSNRGIDFLDKWIAEHLLHPVNDDPATAIDLADQAMEAAKKQGLSVDEISEEVGSVFEVILEMMQRRGSIWTE